MSQSAGAGSPLTFKCWKCRGGVQHVYLKGRKRKRHGRGALGTRSSRWERQYGCVLCGHVGWSNHNDLKRKELK